MGGAQGTWEVGRGHAARSSDSGAGGFPQGPVNTVRRMREECEAEFAVNRWTRSKGRSLYRSRRSTAGSDRGCVQCAELAGCRQLRSSGNQLDRGGVRGRPPTPR